jgi:hypothetical protein
MVARDGIEPPTPAFSGPRSTTELPGLGISAVSGAAKISPERNGEERLTSSEATCRGVNL